MRHVPEWRGITGRSFSRMQQLRCEHSSDRKGPRAGAALCVGPTCRETTLPPHLFRDSLVPMWPSTCGTIAPRVLMQGCSAGEDLLWIVLARICREARGRVSVKWILLSPPCMTAAGWRSVVDGLPLRGGAQFAIHTTMVCAMQQDGALALGCNVHVRCSEGSGVFLGFAPQPWGGPHHEVVDHRNSGLAV